MRQSLGDMTWNIKNQLILSAIDLIRMLQGELTFRYLFRPKKMLMFAPELLMNDIACRYDLRPLPAGLF